MSSTSISESNLLQILREYGGIYLDNDCIVVNEFQRLRKHHCVVAKAADERHMSKCSWLRIFNYVQLSFSFQTPSSYHKCTSCFSYIFGSERVLHCCLISSHPSHPCQALILSCNSTKHPISYKTNYVAYIMHYRW